MDIHLWIVYGYPLRNVLARISVLGYQSGYPRLYGLLKTDIQNSWISRLISVDFWIFMHGFAMDSWNRGHTSTRADSNTNLPEINVT